MTSQGSAYMHLRRALDLRNVTEALSAAAELQLVGLAEALELTLLLADKEPEKFERAAARWHARFVHDSKNVTLGESLAVLALLAAIPGNRSAAQALAELLSRRRGLERPARHLSRGRERSRNYVDGRAAPVGRRPLYAKAHRSPKASRLVETELVESEVVALPPQPHPDSLRDV